MKNYDFTSELISTHCKVGILRATNLVFVVIQFGQSVVQQERVGFSMNFSSVVLFGRFFQLVKWQFWPEISIFGRFSGATMHRQR